MRLRRSLYKRAKAFRKKLEQKGPEALADAELLTLLGVDAGAPALFELGRMDVRWLIENLGVESAHAVLEHNKTEVTVGQYWLCVQRGECTAPKTEPGLPCNWEVDGRDAHPINCVTWEQADRYCRAVGKRLPTEAEWEFAARGREGRKYPWANGGEPARQLCWNGKGNDVGRWGRTSTCPVGAYPAGATPEGVQDMAGNVLEWVADWHDSYPPGPTTDPSGPPSGTARVFRGGGWIDNDPSAMRGAVRLGNQPRWPNYNVGFRCARRAEKP